MRILYPAAEAYPYAKVGGLADVAASLPKALSRLGHEVSVVIPRYPFVPAGDLRLRLSVPMGSRTEEAEAYCIGSEAGVEFFAIANSRYFDRPQVYGYEDDDERFVFFSKAVAQFGVGAGTPADIIHCNDWHTALIPEYIREGTLAAEYAGVASVLTIHNLMYQGPMRAETVDLIGLDGDLSRNLLARGLSSADMVNTVSPRYRDEILTRQGGVNMDRLLQSRSDRLVGILNGVDYEEFDPATDGFLPAPYSATRPEDKSASKRALQGMSGLPVDASAPLLGMVSRLVDQKGLDLVCPAIEGLVEMGTQVVVMGLGDGRYRQMLEDAARNYPDSVAYHATDGEALARLVYAGSDIFLVPSHFEPCGLGALIALRYGSIPIVRYTGGLADTIQDHRYNRSEGLGFPFKPKHPRAILSAAASALREYRRPEEWRALVAKAMRANFSWDRSTREYEELYEQAIEHRRAAQTDSQPLPETARAPGRAL